MNDERVRAAWKAVQDTACAPAAGAAFVLVWALPSIDGGTRRLVSFGLSMALVVLLLEASRSWRLVRGTGRSVR